MNKEMKRSFRNFILKILAVVFVLAMCYFLYAFVYRARTELPAKAVVTNRGCSVYTAGTDADAFPEGSIFVFCF